MQVNKALAHTEHKEEKEINAQTNIIRIYHECEGGIGKSVPRILFWHHKACRVMTNSDYEGRIFQPNPHTNNGFFFLLTIDLLFVNKLPEVPEYAEMKNHRMTHFD